MCIGIIAADKLYTRKISAHELVCERLNTYPKTIGHFKVFNLLFYVSHTTYTRKHDL